MRVRGPHLPQFQLLGNATALDFFQLFCDDVVFERLVTATVAYAEGKKDARLSTYRHFSALPLTKVDIMCFLGCLLLLSVYSAQCCRHAWDKKGSQFMVSKSVRDHWFFPAHRLTCSGGAAGKPPIEEFHFMITSRESAWSCINHCRNSLLMSEWPKARPGPTFVIMSKTSP